MIGWSQAGLEPHQPAKTLIGMEAIGFPAGAPLLFPVGQPMGVMGVGDEIRTGEIAIGGSIVIVDITSYRLWESAFVPKPRQTLMATFDQGPAPDPKPPPIEVIVDNLLARRLLIGLSGDAEADLATLGSLKLIPCGRGLTEAPDWTFQDISTAAGTVRLAIHLFVAWKHAHLTPRIGDVVRAVTNDFGVEDDEPLGVEQELLDGLPTMVFAEAMRLDLDGRFDPAAVGQVDLATDFLLWRRAEDEAG